MPRLVSQPGQLMTAPPVYQEPVLRGMGDENGDELLEEAGGIVESDALDALACLPVLALRDRALVNVCAATLHVAASVRPMLDSSMAGWAADRSASVYASMGGRNIGWWRVQNFRGTLQLYSWLGHHVERRLNLVRHLRSMISAADAGTPAYTRDLSHLCPVPIIDACRTILAVGETLTTHQVNAFRHPDGSLPSCEAAWLADYRQAKAGCLAVLAVLDSGIEQRRLGPLPQFVVAVEAALEALHSMAELTEASVRKRLAWMTELAESRGLAAGAKELAFNSAAPLVQLIKFQQPSMILPGPLLSTSDGAALPPPHN
jgi:hypothetical protein